MFGVRNDDERRPSRLYLWIERTLLGIGMSVAAAAMDHALRRMLAKGPVEGAPRTAARSGGDSAAPGSGAGEDSRPRAELSPPAKQIADQPGR